MKAKQAESEAENTEMKRKQELMEKQLNALLRQIGTNTFFSEEKEQEQTLSYSSPRP